MGTPLNDPVYQDLARLPIMRACQAGFRKATACSLKLLPTAVQKPGAMSRKGENPFCALIARCPGGRRACQQTQDKLQRRLARTRAPGSVTCFAGLTDIAVPVVVGGQHVATLWGGQFFLRKPARRQFGRLRRQLINWGVGRDLRRFQTAYRHTPVVAGTQLRVTALLLDLLAAHLAARAERRLLAQRADEPSCVAQAKILVQTHAGGSLRMGQAAQHVHLSPSYFCKLFRKAAGVTFSDYVARVRVEKAKSLLASSCSSVTEVAGAAGFQSISQFNRAFRRFAGSSPSAYRKALQLLD
jgi:AraC-like DNA-binding protein